MGQHVSGSTRLLFLFGVFSFGAVAIGALVCAMSGVPAGLWSRNLVAWLVGAIGAGFLARTTGSTPFWIILLLSPIALAASFLGRDLEGVHRWISAGPMTLNVALLVLPMTVVAMARVARTSLRPWLVAFLCLGLLTLQPDASQATSFGLVMMVLAWSQFSSAKVKGVVTLAALGLIVAACLRPDPLKPVPEVEGIIKMASAISPLLAGLTLAMSAGVAVAPILGAPPEVRKAGGALAVLFGVWMIAPFFGAFPVPLVGVGLSPVLGAWLGVGMLAACSPASTLS